MLIACFSDHLIALLVVKGEVTIFLEKLVDDIVLGELHVPRQALFCNLSVAIILSHFLLEHVVLAESEESPSTGLNFNQILDIVCKENVVGPGADLD